MLFGFRLLSVAGRAPTRVRRVRTTRLSNPKKPSLFAPRSGNFITKARLVLRLEWVHGPDLQQLQTERLQARQ